MYYAKALDSSNSIRFYDPAMQHAVEARAELVEELRLALESKQFQLHYQVQVDNHGRSLGAEALLRWAHPKRGLIPPMEFIPLLEETGLILQVGLWVLQTACTQLKAWQDNVLTSNLTLAVNISAKQLHRSDIITQVKGVLQESGANPSLLKLELTESVVLEDYEDTIQKMHDLKNLGISFSMDDFGTGYSSLQYLKRLPLDQIKIDRTFVSEITTEPKDAAIVRAIILISEALGLNIIAEGVETKEQEMFLDMNGCHTFQGYLYGKPVPSIQFEAILHTLNL
jgi:EAL domain-containing protein (putative c-di-GMP-specific phosphodiesterase class I)